MALTLDVWQIPSESARRVGHPAPFPVELPERLIELYTFADDLVLDPFMGSGSTLVAAARTGRRYVGYDLDAGYVELARARVEDEGDPIMYDAARVAGSRTCAPASSPKPGSRQTDRRAAQGLWRDRPRSCHRSVGWPLGDRARRTVRSLARRPDLGRCGLAHARSRTRAARPR